MVVPKSRGRCAGDGNAALLFLLHPIHSGLALVHLTNLLLTTRVVQDTLSGGGLSRIDVGHDADVAVLIPRCDEKNVSNDFLMVPHPVTVTREMEQTKVEKTCAKLAS